MKTPRIPGSRPFRRHSDGGIGKQAEYAAARWLNEHGVRVLLKNYHCRYGEIDIIGYDEEVLVFIEVRYRSNRRFGSPEDSVDRRKQQKIVRTAEHFLRKYRHGDRRPCRFDVIVATRKDRNEHFDFTWHQHAFEADQ